LIPSPRKTSALGRAGSEGSLETGHSGNPNSKVVIEMEGGLIQNITANVKVEILVLDADTEGGDEDRIKEIANWMEAKRKSIQEGIDEPEVLPEYVDFYFDQLPKRSKVTDFSHARTVRCHVCGTPFCAWRDRFATAVNAKVREWFTDPLDLADGLCEACRPPEERTIHDEQKDFTHACQASAPFDNPDYLFEIKWDGERTIAFVEDGKIVRLQNRGLQDVFQGVTLRSSASPVEANEAILDGEIVYLEKDGKPPSPNWHSEAMFKTVQDPAALQSHARDLRDLRHSLQERPGPHEFTPAGEKNFLSIMMNKPLSCPYFFIEKRKNLLRIGHVDGYEGIMAKRIDSPYLLGKRSDSWLKMKPQKSAICNVIGYTKGEGHRSLLGALLIAQHRENRLD